MLARDGVVSSCEGSTHVWSIATNKMDTSIRGKLARISFVRLARSWVSSSLTGHARSPVEVRHIKVQKLWSFSGTRTMSLISYCQCSTESECGAFVQSAAAAGLAASNVGLYDSIRKGDAATGGECRRKR